MYKKEVIKFDSLPFEVTVIYGEGHVSDILCEASKKIKYLDCEEESRGDDMAYLITSDNTLDIYLIINQHLTVDILYHEVSHIVYEGLRKQPTPHTDSTDEVFAYTGQIVFDKIYKLLLNKFKINPFSFLKLKVTS